MSSSLNSMEKTLNHQLKKPVVINVLRVVIVVYILFLTSVPRNIISLFQNTLFQLFYLALLAYMALIDPVSALLMAAAYLLTIQQLNRSTIKYNSNTFNNGPTHSIQSNSYVNEKFQEMAHPLNSSPSPVLQMSNTSTSFDNDHPAFKTMTENIAEKTTFTTDMQFQDAQSNFVPDVSQNNGVKTLTNQFTAQGIDLPRGFDADIYTGSQF